MLGNSNGSDVIGVSIEGGFLHAIKIRRGDKRPEVAWVKSLALPSESSMEPESIEMDAVEALDVSSAFLDTASDEDDEAGGTSPAKAGSSGVIAYLSAVSKGSKTPIALAVTEPDVYYHHFDTDWGLKGKKLVRKVTSELEGSRKGVATSSRDSVRLIETGDHRLLSIVSDKEIDFFAQCEAAKRSLNVNPPRAVLVDSVELALANLVIDYYTPSSDLVTVVVHFTERSSRFLFLRGREIIRISPSISEGVESPLLAHTIARRLQLEIDNLNVKGSLQVLLSGAIPPGGLVDHLAEQMPLASVTFFKAHSIGLSDLPPNDRDRFGVFLPALGAALRQLEPHTNYRYAVDLTPQRIRDQQNKLSLSVTGWALLSLLPILAGFFGFEISRLHWNLMQERQRLAPISVALRESDDIDRKIGQATARLESYSKAGALLDSLQIGKHSYGEELSDMMRVCSQCDGSWMTDVATADDGRLQMTGYSLRKDAIPQLVKDLQAEISKVETQEIRRHPVYRFEAESLTTPQ